MTKPEKVRVMQPGMKPTRKVALGAANGAGALVGVNVLLMWWVGHEYGDAIPNNVMNVVLWVNGGCTVIWQTFAGWFVSDLRPRLVYAVQHALDDVLPLPPDESSQPGDSNGTA